MEEQRKYFRIKNNGQIRAKVNDMIVDVFDISAESVSITDGKKVPHYGKLEIQFNFFTIFIEYQYLKTKEEYTILNFIHEHEILKLLEALKKLKNK